MYGFNSIYVGFTTVFLKEELSQMSTYVDKAELETKQSVMLNKIKAMGKINRYYSMVSEENSLRSKLEG